MNPRSQGRSIVPVILSGGSGSRLWPLSREAFPKQLLALAGPNSLIQDTALRTADQAGFGRLMVITNQSYRFIIGEQLRAAGVADPMIVLEPAGTS